MAKVFLDLIFPPVCAYCHAHLGHGQALCETCRRRAVLNRTFFCGKCRARRYSAKGLCHQKFPFVLAAAGEYEDPVIKSLIRHLKFHFVRDAASPLGSILALYAKRLNIERSYDFILPIPLSERRRRERGFNQSELIAKYFSQETMIPTRIDVLRRKRHSPPQSGLKNDAAKRANVAGSFVSENFKAVRGKNIIILDDVVTSGATMLEAALLLRSVGAKNILALAVAKGA